MMSTRAYLISTSKTLTPVPDLPHCKVEWWEYISTTSLRVDDWILNREPWRRTYDCRGDFSAKKRKTRFSERLLYWIQRYEAKSASILWSHLNITSEGISNTSIAFESSRGASVYSLSNILEESLRDLFVKNKTGFDCRGHSNIALLVCQRLIEDY